MTNSAQAVLVQCLIGSFLWLGGLSVRGDIVKVGPIEVFHHDYRPDKVVHVGRDYRQEAGVTNRDVVVVLGNARIDGTVTGKMVVVMGNVELGPEARLSHQIVLVGGEFTRHAESVFPGFDGDKVILPAALVIGVQDWVKCGLLWARPWPHDRAWAWWIFGTVILCYLFLAILMPGPVIACSQVLAERPLASFLAGLLVIILLGPLLVLLAASVIGTIAIPFVLCAMLAAVVLGKAGVNTCLGGRLCPGVERLGIAPPVLEVGIGSGLIGLLCFVPVLGMLAVSITAVLGLGCSLISFTRSLKSESPEAPAMEPPLVRVPSNSSAEVVMPPDLNSILLPRAGFWVRLAATALDLILIGSMIKLLGGEHPERFFLIVWFLYHVLMWGWKGTTIGGVIMGLKIFKQSGASIQFSTALVRAMASFFSALVFFVGFFWAGWTRDKLAWHDIISGTVIAKCPRESVLD